MQAPHRSALRESATTEEFPVLEPVRSPQIPLSDLFVELLQLETHRTTPSALLILRRFCKLAFQPRTLLPQVGQHVGLRFTVECSHLGQERLPSGIVIPPWDFELVVNVFRLRAALATVPRDAS